MKKVIAAAAGLMLAGAMVSTAVAGIEFSGDARARYYFQNDYDFGATGNNGSESEDHWNSRVRLQMKGTTAGGSYAVARVVMQNDAWGSTSDDVGNVTFDRAYVGVPMGCFELTVGRQPLNLTAGTWNDVDLDNIRLKWASEGTTLVGFYSILKSDLLSNSKPLGKIYDDSEDRLYGAAWMQQWDDVWSSAFIATYTQLDLTDTSAMKENGGLILDAQMAGQAGPVALTAELGYQGDGFTATDEGYSNLQSEQTGDDGYGAYITAGMDFDALNVTFVGGMAQDGYVFDAPVGFIMIAGDAVITPKSMATLGSFGGAAVDTWFAGFKTAYQMNETLGFGFNLAYADIESSDGSYAAVHNDKEDTSMYEISASADYLINDGTTLRAEAGYLDIDDAEDPAFGLGLSLELAF